MTGKRYYSVYKTYYCDILGEPCLRVEENSRYHTAPPDCDNCEIAQKPEPPDTDKLYDVVTIIPGKGVFGNKPVTGQEVSG